MYKQRNAEWKNEKKRCEHGVVEFLQKINISHPRKWYYKSKETILEETIVNKKIMILSCICLISLAIVGCSKQESKKAQDKKEVVKEELAEPMNSGKDYILIYYGDRQGETLLSKKVYMNKITGDSIVRELSQMSILDKKISLNSCKEKKDEDKVFLALDFNEDFQLQFSNSGTSGERIMMGSVVNSFLSAFQYDSVEITINGRMLKSGHGEYESLQQKYCSNQEIIIREEVDYNGKKIRVEGRKLFSEMGFSTVYLPESYIYDYDADGEIATIKLRKEITNQRAYFVVSKSSYTLNDTVSGLQLQSDIPLSVENIKVGQDRVSGIQLKGEQEGKFLTYLVMEFGGQVYMVEVYYEGDFPDDYCPTLLAMIKQFAFR